MNEFVQMDIFFFVATLAVVLLTGVATVVLWHIARILRNVEHISEQVSLESDSIRDDLAQVRTDIRRGKGRLKSLFSFFGARVKRASKQ